VIYALIPVFNRVDMTRRIVDHLRAQQGVSVRIVVIDDGSTDGTAEYLAAQRDVITIRGDGTLWWAGAIDSALRQIIPHASDDDYVLLLNNDTMFGPDFVTTLVRVSRENEAAVVGSILRNEAPPHELLSIGPRMNVQEMHVWDLLNELPPEEHRVLKKVYEVDALSGRGTLYPIPVLRRTGFLYPKLLPHYHADYELAARARRKGYRTLVSSEAAVYTANDFGVHRTPVSAWRRMFGKGSPSNIVQRVALRLLIGTPAMRLTAVPRMLLASIPRFIPLVLSTRIRFLLYASRLVGRIPFSGLARARLLMYLPPQIRGSTYNALHAYTAGTLVDVYRKNVLIVGCNVGKDCVYFLRLGARAVHGLDVIEDVGKGFQHRKVNYLRASAEAIPVHDGTYDLVFCFATMEHVPDVEHAFKEMARVTKEGGVIYCVASPLWNSRFGHHKGDLFGKFPWIHLYMTEAEILEMCTNQGVVDPTGHCSMDAHVRYMLNSQYFNKTPAQHYVSTCRTLSNIQVVENSLSLESDDLLTPELYSILNAKGYSREELLAVTHTFIGRKQEAGNIA